MSVTTHAGRRLPRRRGGITQGGATAACFLTARARHVQRHKEQSALWPQRMWLPLQDADGVTVCTAAHAPTHLAAGLLEYSGHVITNTGPVLMCRNLRLCHDDSLLRSLSISVSSTSPKGSRDVMRKTPKSCCKELLPSAPLLSGAASAADAAAEA